MVTEFEIDGHLCSHASSKELSQARAFFSLRHPYVVMADRQGDPIVMIDSNHVFGGGESRDPAESLFTSGVSGLDVSGPNPHMATPEAYFLAQALRHYVTAPFLYASPGFGTEELDPWNENGETWRVLKVDFPPHIKGPARTQYAYYGADRFLRRTRYHIDISPIQEYVNYVRSYDRVDGIWLPTTREVLGCDSSGHTEPDRYFAKVRFVRPFFT